MTTGQSPTSAPTSSVATQVGRHVNRLVLRLQREYLPDGSRSRPTALAAHQLAVLRHADVTNLNADPRVWEVTFDEVPVELLSDGEQPTSAERAIHAALVLYARHQQSRGAPMHVPITSSVGSAARTLALNRADMTLDAAVLRRFHSVLTATGPAQRLHFLRQLVSLFRTRDIPLSYDRLAQDLVRLDDPRRAMGVTLRWGRDLHRTTQDLSNTAADSPIGA